MANFLYKSTYSKIFGETMKAHSTFPKSLLERLDAIGRRMASKPFSYLRPLTLSPCYFKYYNDKAKQVECAVQLTMYWMMYRAKWYLHYLGIDKYVDIESITPEIFKDFATRLIKYVAEHGIKDVGRKASVFDTYIIIVITDIVLRENGYPSVFKLYNTLKELVKGKHEDFVISYEEFCKKAGVEPEKAIPVLKLLMNMFASTFVYGGVYNTTMRNPKYKLPPRNIGFDSLFIRPEKIKRVTPYYDELLEILPPVITPVKVVLKPANLLETGRSGYFVEYNGKPVYTASTREELMEWLKKHGKTGMRVYKIANCWEVEIKR